MASIVNGNVVRITDANDDPVPGAKARFFLSGTSTPVTVYANEALTTPHPSPLVANAAGVLPAVFISDATAVKMTVTTAADVSLPDYTLDPVFKTSNSQGALQVGLTPFPGVSSTNVQDGMQDLQDNIDVADAAIAALAVDGYRLSNIVYLTSGTAATYTPPSGVRAIRVEVVGGGGGGGGSDGQGAGTVAAAGCGGGGEYASAFITNMSQTFTYTIGAGGTAGSGTGPTNGGVGGTTTFTGSVTGAITALGGDGGGAETGSGAAVAQTQGGNSAGGTGGTGGSFRIAGGCALAGLQYGGVLRNAPVSGCAPRFGTTGASNVTASSNGTNGRNPGEGGTGGRSDAVATNFNGGAGAGGLIIIEEFK